MHLFQVSKKKKKKKKKERKETVTGLEDFVLNRVSPTHIQTLQKMLVFYLSIGEI